MADEIGLSIDLRVSKGSLSIAKPLLAQIDMAGTRYSSGVQAIGFAAHEQIGLGADVGTKGWAIFLNLDATNFVQIGRDVAAAFVPHDKLLPGEFCVSRLSAGGVYAQADTAGCDLEFIILEA